MPPVEDPKAAVHASVCTWKDISSNSFAAQVLARVLADGDAFRFDRMGPDEPLQFPFDTAEAESLWAANISTRPDLVYGDLILEKKKRPHTGFMVRWQRNPGGLWLNSVGFWADASYLHETSNADKFLGLLTDLSKMMGAGFGDAYHVAEFDEKGYTEEVLPSGRVGKRGISLKPQDGLCDLFWVNLFGPPYVRLFGRQRLESCPNVEVRWIGPESCLLLTCPSPTQWNLPETRRAVEGAKDHLGRGAFFDRRNRQPPTQKPDWPPEG